MLAGEERNVFAVGDPDQAIYQFRGASSAAFGLFQRHFPGTKLVKLEKNRRSTTPMLQSAFAIIEKNPEVFPTTGCVCRRGGRRFGFGSRRRSCCGEGKQPENSRPRP